MVAGLILAALPLVWAPAFVLVVAMWVALLGGVIVDVVILSRARPRATVQVPRAALIGRPVRLNLELLSRSARSLRAEVRLEVEPPLEAPLDVVLPVEHGTVIHEIDIAAPVRGEGVVHAVWVKLEGPLALIDRIERHSVQDGRVAIVPNAADLARSLEIRAAKPLHRVGHRLELSHGEGTEFDSLQGYVAGMDTRQIDWKSSARFRSLRVRRYRHERDQRVVLCLDTGRLMGAPIDRMQRLDHAIHTALVLSRVALRGRDQVGLHAYGAKPGLWVQPAAGSHQLARLSRACAGLVTESGETNHALGLRAVLSKLSKRSLVIVFTDFTDSTMAELMIEYLQQLARRHLVVFVALDDPAVDRSWREAPTNVETMASAVMTSELRQSRRRVLRQLEIVGVRVVHGEPGEAALGVLEQYLKIKAQGSLG